MRVRLISVGNDSQTKQSSEEASSLTVAQRLGIQPYHSGRVKTKYTRKIITQLAPMTDFCFVQHGTEKMHVSSCGHAMHLSCFDDYYSAK